MQKFNIEEHMYKITSRAWNDTVINKHGLHKNANSLHTIDSRPTNKQIRVQLEKQPKKYDEMTTKPPMQILSWYSSLPLWHQDTKKEKSDDIARVLSRARQIR